MPTYARREGGAYARGEPGYCYCVVASRAWKEEDEDGLSARTVILRRPPKSLSTGISRQAAPFSTFAPSARASACCRFGDSSSIRQATRAAPRLWIRRN